MPVSADFLEMVREAFAFVPELSAKRMFGGAGLMASGRMFAICMDDTLYLKADAETVAVFEAEGLERFVFKGKPMRNSPGYHQAPEVVFEDPDAARQWAFMAIESAFRAKR